LILLNKDNNLSEKDMKGINCKYKNMPNCLSKYRRARGLSQKEVARILGLKNSSVISRWEHGSHIPKPVILVLEIGALYRTLVESLYQDLYLSIKSDVLSKEKEFLEKKTNDK